VAAPRQTEKETVMAYEVKEARTYPGTPDAVRAAAAEVAGKLGGKAAKKPAEGTVDVTFNKDVGGKALLNRIRLVLRFSEAGAGQTGAAAEVFPVDPVGQKLLFGVMGEPARVVATAYWAALDAKLGRPAG
jgi:hypothetical protein